MSLEAHLLATLDPPAGSRLWYGGATLLGSLRGVSHGRAAWKPAAERHSVWQLALHAAYWKYAVRRYFDGGDRGSFPRKPANWPEVPARPDAQAWKADRRLLADEHRRLVEVVRALDPRRLHDKPATSKYTYAELVQGIIMHDAYHAGQIQVVKRLCPKSVK